MLKSVIPSSPNKHKRKAILANGFQGGGLEISASEFAQLRAEGVVPTWVCVDGWLAWTLVGSSFVRFGGDGLEQRARMTWICSNKQQPEDVWISTSSVLKL